MGAILKTRWSLSTFAIGWWLTRKSIIPEEKLKKWVWRSELQLIHDFSDFQMSTWNFTYKRSEWWFLLVPATAPASNGTNHLQSHSTCHLLKTPRGEHWGEIPYSVLIKQVQHSCSTRHCRVSTEGEITAHHLSHDNKTFLLLRGEMQIPLTPSLHRAHAAAHLVTGNFLSWAISNSFQYTPSPTCDVWTHISVQPHV